MSMLTPPGMGGRYRVTGRRFPHTRRARNRRRVALAAVASAAALGLAGWGTYQLVEVFTGGPEQTRTVAAHSGTDCKPAAHGRPGVRRDGPPPPKPGDITVNVYNATPRGGLAKITADELERRGFRIGKVGNAQEDYDKKVTATAVLLGSREAVDGALKVLGTQLGGTEVKNDDRESPQEVDLVLGAAYKSLTPKEDADKALAALTEPPKPSPPASQTAPSASATGC
ncbi:membrane protein [Streptomyces mashuensis]|uniref:Membrane protein n=1 Tax=Streptomyces mashuensis TaxID=33904 RepID=A0A919B269_9ACTN|nr:LytR C-terminal domain-containing protein [Streptomyces mashuensis]GHF42049.1 membrane protein [Streptomyces mashuensis]